MLVGILSKLDLFSFSAKGNSNISCEKSKLTISKKLVVAGLKDQAEITVRIFDNNGEPCPGQKVKINVLTKIGTKKLVYPKEIITKAKGETVFAVSSAEPGFAEFWASVDNVPLSDRTCLEFVPNILFRSKQNENKHKIVLDKDQPQLDPFSFLLKNYYLASYQNPVVQLYKNSNSYGEWQPGYAYPWAPVELNIINGQVGAYKGIVIHHDEENMSVRSLEYWAYKDFLTKKNKFIFIGNQLQNVSCHKKIFDVQQKKFKAAFREYDLAFYDFPYNFYLGAKDPKVYELRSLEKRPAHVGRNTGVSVVDKEMIGIVLAGNYQRTNLSQSQKNNLKALIIMLAYVYKMDFSQNYPFGSQCLNDPAVVEFKSVATGESFSWLTGHRSFKDKICPGNKAMRWLEQERPQIITELNKLRTED